MKRLKLEITSVSEAIEFANRLNSADSTNYYLVQNEDGSKESDPRTQLGMMYALSEFDNIYLVNNTDDGVFPNFIK